MDRQSLKELRRQRGYPTFVGAATFARVADEMFSVGVVLLVLERTGSAVLAGATVACVTFPSLITAPFLGAWLDLTGRRRIAMIVDQILAASALTGILFVAGHGSDILVPLLGLLVGLTYPLSFGGFTSLIPSLVPARLLPPANALEATSFNTALIAGPAIAGTIVAVAGPAWAVGTEIVLTVAALALILRIPELDRPPREEGSLTSVAAAGLRHLVRTPQLRGATAAAGVGLGGLGLLSVAFPFFAVEELGSDSASAGYLWAAFAVGSALGANTLVRLQTRYSPERVVLGSLAVFGSLILLWPLATTLPMAMALIFIAGVADGPGLAATFAVRQRFTPEHLHGQVFTTAVGIKIGSLSLGAAGAGPLLHAIGPGGMLLVAGSAQIVAAAVGVFLMRVPWGTAVPEAGRASAR